jgi:hypothetical protein
MSAKIPQQLRDISEIPFVSRLLFKKKKTKAAQSSCQVSETLVCATMAQSL